MKRRWLCSLLLLTVLLAGCQVKGNPLPQGMEEETVLTQGREIVTLLNQGELQEVYDRLRPASQEGASLEKFQAAMTENLDKAGAYGEEKEAMATGQTLKSTGEEYGTAVLLCRHEKKNVLYRVAFSREMELMGIEVTVR